MATVEGIPKLLLLMSGRQKSMDKDIKAEFKRVVLKTTDDAKQMLSGTVKTKQLRKMGHPYARALRMKADTAKPRIIATKAKVRKVLGIKSGTMSPLPINKQSGKLFASQYIKTWKTGRDINYRYGFNESQCRYAKWITAKQGTRKMRERGFWKQVKANFYLYARATTFGNRTYQAKLGGN